jgi:hypothetical protein
VKDKIVMGVSHSRFSGMDAPAMHSHICEADTAVTIGSVGLGSEVIQEFTADSASVGPPPGGEIGTVNYTLGLVVSTLRTYYLQNQR